MRRPTENERENKLSKHSVRKRKTIAVTVSVALVCIALAASAVFCIVFPLSFREEIERSAREFGLDPALVASIVRAESGFDPNAVSAKGAQGLMQLMPETAAWQAQRIGHKFTTLTSPPDNIRLGCAYYKYLYDKYGATLPALAAYNAGEGNVDRWLSDLSCSDGGTLTFIPFPETRAYCDRVLGAVRFYRLRFP